jgi:hypothetical protein
VGGDDMSEPLKELINAVDTACWCWAVQKNSKRKGQVKWRSAFDELQEAYEKYQTKTSELVAIIPEDVTI